MLFKDTDLWRNAFVNRDSDVHHEILIRLEASYVSIWKKAVVLSGFIAKDVPSLTLHDEKHFEALWRSADIIHGPAESLNPLEVFIFGCAILVHDLANTIRTYDGGLEELKRTDVWKDIFASLAKQNNPDCDLDNLDVAIESELERDVLFITLRMLHAERAEFLAYLKVTNAKGDDISFLIEDEGVRNHLGELIGQIAASHNWPIERVLQEFEGVRGAPSGFPYQWNINPLRLACLLRCADAVQIDQARAPDFLFALLQLSGISEQHWRAQNRLATATPDRKDKASLLFTSTKTFIEDDAEAWWIAHDAILVADKELDDCSRLLRDLDMPMFQINGVKDARSPSRLATRVKAKGWRPIRARPKMGDTSRIISMMGGAQLYGNDSTVPLRELLQNAADAIRARNADGKDHSFRGRINVSLANDDADQNRCLISVEDNGIGMSELVLTGPLIEFGTSYWKSELVRKERPGLMSSRINQTGGFGIGFFSCFMVSDHVLVTSRMYDASIGDFRTLEFKGGLLRHPILLDGARPVAPSSVSTRVIMYVNETMLKNMLTIQTIHSDQGKKISFKQLISHMCPCLDVDVFVSENGSAYEMAHRANWNDPEHRASWLSDITLAEARAEKGLSEYLQLALQNLEEMRDKQGRIVGLACMGFRDIETGIVSIGGLIAGQQSRHPLSFSKQWVGAFSGKPDGPRRFFGKIAHEPKERALWASNQVEKIAAMADLSERDRHVGCVNAAEFGSSPLPILELQVKREFCDRNKLTLILEGGATLWMPITSVSLQEGAFTIDTVRNHRGFFSLGKRDIEFLEETLERYTTSESRPSLYMVPDEFRDCDLTILGCLITIGEGLGRRWAAGCDANVVLARYIGPDSPRENLYKGQEISGPACWFKLQ